MPCGHIETDPSTSDNFVTLNREYPNAPCLQGITKRIIVARQQF